MIILIFILYLFLIGILSAVVGLFIYKLTDKIFHGVILSYLLGGIVTIVLSFLFAYSLTFSYLFYGMIVGIIVYIIFLVIIKK